MGQGEEAAQSEPPGAGARGGWGAGRGRVQRPYGRQGCQRFGTSREQSRAKGRHVTLSQTDLVFVGREMAMRWKFSKC